MNLLDQLYNVEGAHNATKVAVVGDLYKDDVQAGDYTPPDHLIDPERVADTTVSPDMARKFSKYIRRLKVRHMVKRNPVSSRLLYQWKVLTSQSAKDYRTVFSGL
jgi:hypothetical protein